MRLVQISILIVSYRTPVLTRAAVRSALAISAVDEVIVVDNASGDQTIDILDALDDPRVRLIANEMNIGFGSAQNSAARVATADALLFLNSDAALIPTALARVIDVVADAGGRCLAAPRMVTPGGEIQRSAGVLPSPLNLTLAALGLRHMVRVAGRLSVVARLTRWSRVATEYESARTATETIDTTMVSGACFAIGREAFMELGGFDERFFMYFEDADLCRRAAAVGMPIRYVPSAVVTHIGGASSSEDYHFGPLHARAMRQYLGKWYGPGGSAFALVLLWLRAFGMTLLLQGGARRAWRAWWAAVRDEEPRR